MQVQNYQEELLAPVPSHPRASLSDAYRPHLIPLPPSRACRGTNFRLSHRAHSFAQSNEKALLTMEDGLVSPFLAAAINQIYCQSYLNTAPVLTSRKRVMLVTFSAPDLSLFGRHRTNGCDLPRRGCIRGVKEPRGWLAAPRYAAPHVQTLAQVSRSVRDRERVGEKVKSKEL